MNKAFKKILERLEEDARLYNSASDVDQNIRSGLIIAKEVVQEVAEEYNGGWIRCDVKMPEERDSIFAQFKETDKWKNSMFERMSEFVNATVEFEDGTRMVKTLHTVDGKWYMGSVFLKYKVIAWQPLPSPFREIEVNSNGDILS